MGPGGLLGGLTKQVLETSLEVEMTDHLGYEKHPSAGRNSGNNRNGTRSKTVITEVGRVEIDVPRVDVRPRVGVLRRRCFVAGREASRPICSLVERDTGAPFSSSG